MIGEVRKLLMPVEIGIVSDALAFFKELLRQKGSIIPRDRSSWFCRCKEWQRRYPVVLPEYRQQKKYVNPYVLIDVPFRGDDRQ